MLRVFTLGNFCMYSTGQCLEVQLICWWITILGLPSLLSWILPCVTFNHVDELDTFQKMGTTRSSEWLRRYRIPCSASRSVQGHTNDRISIRHVFITEVDKTTWCVVSGLFELKVRFSGLSRADGSRGMRIVFSVVENGGYCIFEDTGLIEV